MSLHHWAGSRRGATARTRAAVLALGIMALVVVVTPGRSGAAAPLYHSPVVVETGDTDDPSSFAVGDVTHDGFLDLVVPNYLDGTVSVIPGLGDGTFGRKTDYNSGITDNTPAGVAIADLNGDGNPDLLVCSWAGPLGNGFVSVLKGRANGTFSPYVRYNTMPYPSGLALADVNKDGKLDAVTACVTSGITVLRGFGDGSFPFRTDFPLGVAPKAIAIGDLNGDNNPDIVVVGAGTSVCMGNGTGAYVSHTDYPQNGFSVAIGDVNGDHKPDLVFPNAVMLGHGDGAFDAAASLPTGAAARAVALGDFNGDGIADIAVSNVGVAPEYRGSLSVLIGLGGGTFAPRSVYPAGFNSLAVCVADLDADGKQDVAVENVYSNSVSIFRGKGDGTFPSASINGTGSTAQFVAAGDLNQDQIADLVVACSGTNTVSVLKGLGNGLFAPAVSYAAGNNPYWVAIGDLNHDAKPDLVVASYGSNAVNVLLNAGNGTFPSRVPYPVGTHPISISLGDLNGDTNLDIAVSNKDSQSASIMLGLGNGAFGARNDTFVGYNPGPVLLADIDNDHKLDMTVARLGADTLLIQRGNGDGSLGAQLGNITGLSPEAFTVGDVNNDGIADFAVADHNANAISVLLGTGGGNFSFKVDYVVGVNPRHIVIEDLNGDGRPDIAASCYGENVVSVLLGQGNGAFGQRVDYAAGETPAAVAIADVTGDGRPDISVANSIVNTASVLRNTSDYNTPTLLSRFDAEADLEGVRLTWSVDSPVAVAGVTVERAPATSGPWAEVPVEWGDQDGLSSALDPTAEPGVVYWYRVDVAFADGTHAQLGPIRASRSGTAGAGVPDALRVLPNPTRNGSRIEYAVSRRERVRLVVMDVTGRLVATLVDRTLEPGRYTAAWDGRTERSSLQSGVYFVRQESAAGTIERRLVLLR